MEGLLPIIRRARRPLLPPDDPAPVVPLTVLEPPSVLPRVVKAIEAVAGEAPSEQGSERKRPRKKEAAHVRKAAAT